MPVKKLILFVLWFVFAQGNLAGQNIYVPKNPYGSQSALAVGDVVTVVIDEFWQGNYFFELERDDKITIKSLPDKEAMKFLSGADAVKNITSRQKGKSSGGNKLKGGLSVLVSAVNNDGSFQISGGKFISLDGESNSIQLRGIIHPRDLQEGYKIPSQKIANLTLNFQGKMVRKRYPLRDFESAGGTPDAGMPGVGAEQRRAIVRAYLEEILGEFLDQNLRQ